MYILWLCGPAIPIVTVYDDVKLQYRAFASSSSCVCALESHGVFCMQVLPFAMSGGL